MPQDFVILDLRIRFPILSFLKASENASGVWSFGHIWFTIGLAPFFWDFIDFANLIIPKKWCYFNVNKPIEPLKLLEKSSILSRYRGGKVEFIIKNTAYQSGFIVQFQAAVLFIL